MNNSEFLTGNNDRKWKADIDWLISNDTNIIKVLEGKYDDKEEKKQLTEKERKLKEAIEYTKKQIDQEGYGYDFT